MLSRNSGFGWRREARHDGSVACARSAIPAKVDFVPIIAEAPAPEPPPRVAASVAPVIEVKLAGAVVRVSGIDDGAQRVCREFRVWGLFH